MDFRFRWKSGLAADITSMTEFDPQPTSNGQLWRSVAALFNHVGGNEFDGRRAVIDVLVDFAGLGEDRIADRPAAGGHWRRALEFAQIDIRMLPVALIIQGTLVHVNA